MFTIDDLELVNSKILHDLGNIVITMQMQTEIDDFNKEDAKEVYDNAVAKFKVLRNCFAGLEPELTLEKCYNQVYDYFAAKKIVVNINKFYDDNKYFYNGEYLRMLFNLIMFLVYITPKSTINLETDSTTINCTISNISNFDKVLSTLQNVEIDHSRYDYSPFLLIFNSIIVKEKCTINFNKIDQESFNINITGK